MKKQKDLKQKKMHTTKDKFQTQTVKHNLRKQNQNRNLKSAHPAVPILVERADQLSVACVGAGLL